MDTKNYFGVKFEGKNYNLTYDQVKELQKIRDYCGTNIELSFKLKDDREVLGTVIKVEGVSLLYPGDEFVPTVFKIKTSETIEELNFLMIESFTRIY